GRQAPRGRVTVRKGGRREPGIRRPSGRREKPNTQAPGLAQPGVVGKLTRKWFIGTSADATRPGHGRQAVLKSRERSRGQRGRQWSEGCSRGRARGGRLRSRAPSWQKRWSDRPRGRQAFPWR